MGGGMTVSFVPAWIPLIPYLPQHPASLLTQYMLICFMET